MLVWDQGNVSMGRTNCYYGTGIIIIWGKCIVSMGHMHYYYGMFVWRLNISNISM